MEESTIDIRISILGSGNVATHFAQKWFSHNIRIVQVFSKTLKNARILAKKVNAQAIKDLEKINVDVDLLVISISDDAIEKIISNIPSDFNGIVAHTSGSIGLKKLKKSFKSYGILYPLQSFSHGFKIVNDQFPLLVDGNNKKVRNQLDSIGQLISKNIHYLTSEQKQKLHLSAVFANNFSNHIFSIAEKLCEAEGLNFELLLPLIRETTAKLEEIPIDQRQTGPAIRQDIKTIDLQLKLLQDTPNWSAIYDILSKDIQKMHHS